jgi:hypothetical protein
VKPLQFSLDMPFNWNELKTDGDGPEVSAEE